LIRQKLQQNRPQHRLRVRDMHAFSGAAVYLRETL
jgi:hypothetical protein